MSLINKMLQDLDRRNAIQDTPDTGRLRRQVRAVGRSGLGPAWLWVLGGLIAVALAAGAWLLWQRSSRPAPPQPVVQAPPPAPRPAPAPAIASAQPDPAASAQPPSATPQNDATAPKEVYAALAPAAETLRLATELASRPAGPRLAAAPARQPAPKALAGPEPAQHGVAPVSARSAPAEAVRTALPVSPAGAQKETAPARAESAPGHAAAAPKIDRKEAATPRAQAEAEFRRGVTLVNQGRVAEGMDSFRAALAHDPGHEAARQTMVALLVESKRLEEAGRLLKEGLSVNPGNSEFGMLFARLTVERGDAAGALAVLDRYGAGAAGSAEHRAFRAALLQRLGRHKEAIEEYRASVGLVPGAGPWWVGLGISQQATAHPRDALESFRRAKGAGNLTPELVSFVDERIRQLQ